MKGSFGGEQIVLGQERYRSGNVPPEKGEAAKQSASHSQVHLIIYMMEVLVWFPLANPNTGTMSKKDRAGVSMSKIVVCTHMTLLTAYTTWLTCHVVL